MRNNPVGQKPSNGKPHTLTLADVTIQNGNRETFDRKDEAALLTVFGGSLDRLFGPEWIADELKALAGLYHSCAPSSYEMGAESEARNNILPYLGNVLNQIAERLIWGAVGPEARLGKLHRILPLTSADGDGAGFHGGLKVRVLD